MEEASIEVFLSYSHKDSAYKDRLAVSLKLLERQHTIKTWHDRKIGAGSEWKEQIDSHLESSQIILLLISPDFLASDYCYDIEMKRALERHALASATVIPIILRPCDWQHSPFSKLEALPVDGRAINTYPNRDLAFEEVVVGIRAVINERSQPSHLLAASPSQPAPPPSSLPQTISAESPLLVGFAIDVSGSMQQATAGLKGAEVNRLQGVFDVIKRLAGAEENSQDLREASASLPLDAVKVFAYGFGFTDRAADYGALAGLARRFLGSAIPALPTRVRRGKVRDLFEIAGLGSEALLLSTLSKRWSELESGLWEQRVDLFGDTPMASAMNLILQRFKTETAENHSPKVLFVISDGDSTDGPPLEACHAMQAEGVTIVCGYLTNSDVTEPRKLYGEAVPSWPEGAKALFACASMVGEEAHALNAVVSQTFEMPTEQRWHIDPTSRLFLQLNQSEILSEFVTAVLSSQAEVASSN